jgi:hypothetical protein
VAPEERGAADLGHPFFDGGDVVEGSGGGDDRAGVELAGQDVFDQFGVAFADDEVEEA